MSQIYFICWNEQKQKKRIHSEFPPCIHSSNYKSFFATFSCQELLSQASVLQIKKNQGHTKGLSFIIHASFFFFCLFCDKYQGVFPDLSQKKASVATSWEEKRGKIMRWWKSPVTLQCQKEQTGILKTKRKEQSNPFHKVLVG